MTTRPAKGMIRPPEARVAMDAYRLNAVNPFSIPTYTIMPDYGMGPYAWIQRPPFGRHHGVGGNCADRSGWDGDHPISNALHRDFLDWVITFERAPQRAARCAGDSWTSVAPLSNGMLIPGRTTYVPVASYAAATNTFRCSPSSYCSAAEAAATPLSSV